MNIIVNYRQTLEELLHYEPTFIKCKNMHKNSNDIQIYAVTPSNKKKEDNKHKI